MTRVHIGLRWRPDPHIANTPDATGVHAFHFSLTQRVFLAFSEAKQPLDRKHVKMLLSIGDEGLKHAMERLEAAGCVRKVDGRWGFYELVPGAVMPADTRGKSERSQANLKRGRAIQVAA